MKRFDSDFEKRFKKSSRRFNMFFIINILIMSIIIIGGIYLIFLGINNPEVIGGFLGKIVNGFNNAK